MRMWLANQLACDRGLDVSPEGYFFSLRAYGTGGLGSYQQDTASCVCFNVDL